MIKTIINHFQYLEKRFCVYISFFVACTESVELESFFDMKECMFSNVSGAGSTFGLQKTAAIAVADLRGGVRTHAPPRRPNSFNFMQFLGEFGKIVCSRPPPWRVHAPPWEILDPSLHCAQS